MRKNSKIPIVVVGTGFLGEFHIQQILKIPEFRLVGIFDIDSIRLQEISYKYKVKAFNSLDSALTNADAVSIVVPTPYHHKIAFEALKYDCDIFIEKPISDTVSNAKKIKYMNTNNKCIQVGHIERYNKAYIKLLGYSPCPIFIESHRIASYKKRGTEVSVIHDLMIHDIDIINSFFLIPIKNIYATGVAVITDSIDIANARIEYVNGAVANITASRVSQKQMRKMRLFEKNKYYSMDFISRSLELYSINKSSNKLQSKKYNFENNNPLYNQLSDFAISIKNRKEPKVTIDAAIEALEIANRIEDQIIKSQK